MSEHRVKRTVILVCAAFFFLNGLSQRIQAGPPRSLVSVLEEAGVRMEGAAGFTVEKDVFRRDAFRTILAKHNGRVMKIEATEGLDAAPARRQVEESLYVITSLYRRHVSPYPGVVSQTIECPPEFKPQETRFQADGVSVPLYLLYGTARLTYGVCIDELAVYRAVLAFVYSAPRRTLYRIELFIPREEFVLEEALGIMGTFSVSGARRTPAACPQARPSFGKQREKREAAAPLNVIIIGLEPLGAGHVGAYGYARDTTPHLDAFAEDSFLFQDAVSPSSWTLPAFMSWFTSLYPSQHKLRNKYMTYTEHDQVIADMRVLSPSAATLAQVLKNNGYLTAGFTGGAGMGREFGYDLGFDTYYDEGVFNGLDAVLPRAEAWIKKHKDRKFFVFIQGYDVHGRHPLPRGFNNRFADPRYRGTYRGTPHEYWALRDLSLEQGRLSLDAEDVAFWRAWYDAQLYEADEKLGAFFEKLKKLGLMQKSIVVFSSGSGNEFYEHGRFDHGFSLYEELIRVPLVIRVPGEKGGRVAGQVRTIDIMPTVLDLVGADVDEALRRQMQGTSLRPMMRGEFLALDAYSETDYLFQYFKRSVRCPDGWKFIYSLDTQERELYHLTRDPLEKDNLVDAEPRRAGEMEEKLLAWMEALRTGTDR